MPGPWEKYAQSPSQETDQPSGPWTKYAQPSESSEKPGLFDGSVKSAIDSLPMVGGVVGGILGTPADAVVGPVGNMVGAGIGGYLGTATKNLINRYYDPESAPKTAAQAITQPVVGGVEQGLMQGTGEAVAPVINKALTAAPKWAGTKILSSLGGVKPETIKEYAQFSDRINAAPNVDALKDISDQFVSKLSSDVEAKQLTVEQAKDALKGLQSDLKDAFRTAGYDARDAVTSAQQTLKDAHGARLQQLSGDVYDTINKLKSEVKAGSGQALKTLEKSNAQVDLAPIYSSIDSSIDQLQKAGTDEAIGVAGKLQEYKSRLMSQSGDKIPAPLAKRLIQGLDQVTEYSPMAGSFDKAKNAAFKDVRSVLDQTLKSSVPEYAKAMEPVANNASLLERVSDFGDKQQAVSLLSRINAPNQMERAAALQELGQKYGADFVAGANPKNLPEQQLLQKAQAAQEALRPDRVTEKLEQSISGSRQKSAFDSARTEFEAAQQKLAPFRPLAPNGSGQTQAQQKLMQLGKGGNIELEDMFRKLGSMTNTDFVQAMKDQNTLAAFKKGATNGSRNTLMGAIAGFAFGGPAGIATGGVAGRAVDQYGPAITKKVLDAAIRVSRTPTVATIAKLNLPEPIKRNMIVGLENYLANGGQQIEQSAVRVADSGDRQNRSPAKGEDRWAQQGLSKLGIQDQEMAQRLMQDKKAKQLLIQASDLAPGSKAMQRIQDQIQKGFGKNK